MNIKYLFQKSLNENNHFEFCMRNVFCTLTSSNNKHLWKDKEVRGAKQAGKAVKGAEHYPLVIYYVKILFCVEVHYKECIFEKNSEKEFGALEFVGVWVIPCERSFSTFFVFVCLHTIIVYDKHSVFPKELSFDPVKSLFFPFDESCRAAYHFLCNSFQLIQLTESQLL